MKQIINNFSDISQLDAKIKPVGVEIKSNILGKIQEYSENEVIFKISEGFTELMNHRGGKFNVEISYNRSTYQLQHYSLDWFKKHALFNILVKNPMFESTEQSKSAIVYPFLMLNSTTLNMEQQMAVQSIVTRSNGKIPFLLFGPPGKKTLDILKFMNAYIV